MSAELALSAPTTKSATQWQRNGCLRTGPDVDGGHTFAQRELKTLQVTLQRESMRTVGRNHQTSNKRTRPMNLRWAYRGQLWLTRRANCGNLLPKLPEPAHPTLSLRASLHPDYLYVCPGIWCDRILRTYNAAAWMTKTHPYANSIAADKIIRYCRLVRRAKAWSSRYFRTTTQQLS